MTIQEKENITKRRKDGCSYSQIARRLSINENTVKTFCRRHGLTGVRQSVYITDPTADAAMANLMWSSFQEKLRKEEPQLSDILSWDAYGYTRDEILLKLKRKVTDKSWYYYQWSRIRKL